MTDVPTESPRRFQLERLILFSDAVFAIAITLLIIEIKVPQLHPGEISESALLLEVFHLVPKFIGFLISFMLIGMYWTRHHILFGYVIDYTPRLIRLNLLFLFFVVLMPFSTGIFGEYSTPGTIHLKTPLVIYVMNISSCGLILFLLWHYVGNPGNNVAAKSLDPEVAKQAKRRAALIAGVFALTIPVAFVNPYAARYVPLLIPVVVRVSRKRVRKTT